MPGLSLKAWAVAGLVAIAACSGSYFAGKWEAARDCEADSLRAEIAALEERNAALRVLNRDHAERLKADEAAARAMLAELAATPANEAPCLDRDAARRVRGVR